MMVQTGHSWRVLFVIAKGEADSLRRKLLLITFRRGAELQAFFIRCSLMLLAEFLLSYINFVGGISGIIGLILDEQDVVAPKDVALCVFNCKHHEIVFILAVLEISHFHCDST